MGKRLLDKLWERHVVATNENGLDLLYIDLHLVHEVTSPQAFEGLRLTNRTVRRPDLTFATMDHNIPTKDVWNITDRIAKQQLDTLRQNCKQFQVPLADIGDEEQGIVHVIGPELGLTQPGKTIVCGDSHTATHGAFGALAFGIGTSEVEHVLATQTLWQRKPKAMGIELKESYRKVSMRKILFYTFFQSTGSSWNRLRNGILRRGHSCYGYGREDDALQYGN